MRCIVVVVACLLAGANPISAAEATGEEAQRLVEVFHRYVGTPAAGEADHVRVVPQGETYRVEIDIGQLAKPLEPYGVTFEGADVSFAIQPLPDGTWRVSELTLPSPMTIDIAGEATTYRWEGIRFEGIYDPSLASYLSVDYMIATTSTEARGAVGTATSHIGEQVIRGTASAAADGAVDAEFRQTMTNFVAQQSIVTPVEENSSDPAVPPVEFAYSFEAADMDLAIKAFESAEVLELWADLVALAENPDGPDAAGEERVKERLRSLLPIYRSLDETVTIEDMRVGTSLGEFGVEDIVFTMTLPGIVDDAHTAMTFGLEGPSLPSHIVPQWAGGLVPTALDFGFTLSGFDLDKALRHLIETFDAERLPPFEDSDLATAGELALTEDGVSFKLLPGRIDSPLLDLSYEGELTLAFPQPHGTIAVTATGLDDAIASLDGASGDMTESQVLGFLTVAKMWGRPGADGGIDFVFEINRDGSVTVNGQMLKPAGGTPL